MGRRKRYDRHRGVVLESCRIMSPRTVQAFVRWEKGHQSGHIISHACDVTGMWDDILTLQDPEGGAANLRFVRYLSLNYRRFLRCRKSLSLLSFNT
ncbi:hypothetical protein SUGI_0983130 [Cryptomeria japonica]|nr:hypothetical protein SUGI_0983130 [Cryptomeria japonica]